MDGDLFGQMVDTVGVGVGAYDDGSHYIYVCQSDADMLDTDRERVRDNTISAITVRRDDADGQS